MADPRIQLLAYFPNNTQQYVGELVLGDPMPQNKDVIIPGTFATVQHGVELGRFVDLRLSITSNDVPPRPWGSVASNMQEVVRLGRSGNTMVAFKWHLHLEDLEAMERHRAGGRYVTFNIGIEALVLIGDDTSSALHSVRGEGQLTLSVTEWEDRILTPLGYKLPPSWDRLMPDASYREHPDWTDAEKRLAEARKSLRRYEGRDALGSALDAFESILSKPFDAAQWRAKLKSIPDDLLPEQKREAISDMLAGFCTYLNRVGHHRARQAPSTPTPLPAMPVDQWEAELAIAAAHFLLPSALRMVNAAQSAASGQPAMVTT